MNVPYSIGYRPASVHTREDTNTLMLSQPQRGGPEGEVQLKSNKFLGKDQHYSEIPQ